MSDGPHRSLPMRPSWKLLAKIADNTIFAPEEVCNTIVPALMQDWRADISAALLSRVRHVFEDEQGSLFKDQKIAQLEALGRLTAGHGLGRTFLDCAIEALTHTGSTPEALLDAVRNALLDRAWRGARQVEEHYYRKSNEPRALNVRSRINDGIKDAPLDAFARQLLNLDPVPAWCPPVKQQGLDDGVPY
ncbi:hypothetical protein [Azospirillum argentinense]|uniref:hypothetical protein n=1 Tax=Azospirillum argentinense TaxID=2970906 RepID=UPI0010C121D3|nr:hypothetical protein [Azospirillum argentinense]